MEILFCDRCHESIPDADIESGKSVRVGGKVLHVPCAFRRAMPGPGRTLTLLLALLGAAGAAYAVARIPSPEEGRASDRALSDAWRRDMDESTTRAGQGVQRSLADLKASIEGQLAAASKTRDEQSAAQRLEIERTLGSLNGKVDAYTDAQTRRLEAVEAKVAEIAGWAKEVRDLAARSAAVAPPTPEPGAMQEPVPVPGPVPPTPGGPTAGPGGPDPEAQKRHDAEVDRWIERLKDPDNGLSFSATYKLKDLKDLRAVPPLIDTLKTHKDYYTRLGAATALGELHACDAVLALIEALEDREDLVQTAAGEALTTITGRDSRIMVGLTKKERRQLKDEWSKWWKDHEGEVRQRLAQPAPPK